MVGEPGVLRDVARRIAQGLSVSQSDGLRSLAAGLAPFRSPTAAVELLETLLADGEALAQVAARSYIHVNGFDKLVLLSATDAQWELRLHVWWPGAAPDAEQGGSFRSHNHRWDLTSYVLTGGLRIQHFDVLDVAGEEPLFRYRYLPLGGGDELVMESTGMGSLRLALDCSLAAGDHYALSHHVQHQVEARGGDVTATLVLRGRPHSAETTVFASSPVSSQRLPVSRLDEGGVAARLQRLLQHLGSRT